MLLSIFPKIKTLFSQIIIGFLGGVIDFVLLIILSKFIKFEFAFIIGISIAILINYIFTIKYSFKTLSKFKNKQIEIFNYYVGYLFTILIQIIVMYLFIAFNVNFMLAKLIAILCGFIVSVLLKFNFIFGKNSEF